MGILLSPATGRGVAFAIIGVPLALFLYLGFSASGGSGPGGGDSGGYPYPQSLPLYTQSQPVYPEDTSTSVPTSSSSGFAAPVTDTDTVSDALGTTDSTGVTSDSATVTDSATESATDASTAPTGGATSSTPASGTTGAAAVVVTAYADLNRHDYRSAYDLGLGRNGQNYQAFVEGYATTASDAVTVTGVDGDVVSVSLVAVRTDGTRHTYTGTYTVTGGVITGADIQQVN